MANIKNSQDRSDNPYDQDVGDYPPLGEEILAQLKQMVEDAEGDVKNDLQELLNEKLGISPKKPVGPVQPVLTSQFVIVLTFLLLFASLFGKRFVLDLNITSSIHYSDFCFL